MLRVQRKRICHVLLPHTSKMRRTRHTQKRNTQLCMQNHAEPCKRMPAGECLQNHAKMHKDACKTMQTDAYALTFCGTRPLTLCHKVNAWLGATYTAAALAWQRAALYIHASTEAGLSAWTGVGSVAATGALVPGRNVESLCGCLCGAHECDEDPACHS